MAWAKVIWIHPVQRRMRTQLSLTGKILTQELAAVQTREVRVRGCSQLEYAQTVTESAATPYVESLQHQASEEITFGVECFNVQGSGQRKLKPGSVDNGSYMYTPNCS